MPTDLFGGEKNFPASFDVIEFGAGVENSQGGSKTGHGETPVGLSMACLGNPPDEDCRALETATGAAGYFPFGIVFRPRPASNDDISPRSKGKKKASAFGPACPPVGVSSTNAATLALSYRNVNRGFYQPSSRRKSHGPDTAIHAAG
jgi:hypothetical protein